MSAAPRYPADLGYNGLRMSADEFLALDETQDRYELIDGVVVMAPAASPDHNEAENEIAYQLTHFAKATGKIRVFPETDLRLSAGKVYKPDLMAYLADRLKGKVAQLATPPDLIVEILSPGTKPLDLITKRDDYEQFGVGEYWVYDPHALRLRAWRRSGIRLLEVPADGDAIPCAAIAGFTLSMRGLRQLGNNE